MDRLLLALPDLAVAAACWGVRKDSRNLSEELRVTSEALAREREHVWALEKRVAELRANRDHWMDAHDKTAAKLKALREENEMSKKPMPINPGMPPGKGVKPSKPPGKKPKK